MIPRTLKCSQHNETWRFSYFSWMWCMRFVCQTLMDALFPRWRSNSHHTQGEELMSGGRGNPSKVYLFYTSRKKEHVKLYLCHRNV
jgi:hypothetical protein